MAHRWATVLGCDEASVGGQEKVTWVTVFSLGGWLPRLKCQRPRGSLAWRSQAPGGAGVRRWGERRTPGPGRGPEHSRPHLARPDPPSSQAPREWELLSRGRWRPTQES